MRSFAVVAVAMSVGACGDVLKVPDAGSVDAYVADTASAVTCGPGEMNCNGTCANLMTSELYCGNCTTQCSPTQGCLNGSCVPANTSCSRVRDLDPAAPDGVYRNVNTGVAYYCDFANNQTYDAFGFGAHNAGYAGYTFMSSADFNNPAIQKAFIALYNDQSGLINLQPGWTGGNCCFKSADAGAGQVLTLATHYLYPAHTSSNATQCGGNYTDTRYRFYEAEVGPYAPVPMPDDYFATHPATITAACSDTGSMPAFFMKRRNGLN